MGHCAVKQVLKRAELGKSDSDFTYFYDLLLAAEALAKVITVGMLAAIVDDKDRNRYRLAHGLVRGDGLGDWGQALEDILTGPASQFLHTEAYTEQAQLTRLCHPGEWQYEAVHELKKALDELGIDAEDLPTKTDMKRWFRLLAVLRNKTKAHGAIKPSVVANPAASLARSISSVYENFSLFDRPWVYLHRNISGKYRVAVIAGDCSPFDYLKRESSHTLPDGVYIWWDSPKLVPLLETSFELDNFFFANGGYGNKGFELLSYATGDRRRGDAANFSAPPGILPASETKGSGELLPRKNCLSNAPNPLQDYVDRPELQSELLSLVLDRRRAIVTLRGKGGIGKTSLALRVLQEVYAHDRFTTVVWLSARDVDLQQSGPKLVRPDVVSPDDMGLLYSKLVLSDESTRQKGFKAKTFLESQLENCESGACLFVLDNFETTQNPLEIFAWIDTYVRLPNKVLITTRLRDFKGDYPVDVNGMNGGEARALIDGTGAYLGISHLLTSEFVEEVIERSGGHPYVIKILLGEVAKNGRTGSIPHLIAGSDDILTALFERTYAALSPCAQRAFLTLSAWSSSVPRLALEAVLLRSTQERHEVESGLDMLVQYSLAESHQSPEDGQEFFFLPLVAATFGKKKLNINPHRNSIKQDVEVLQMLGPSRRDDLHLGLSRKLENFVSGIAKRVEAGESFDDYAQILEMICRNYPPGWLSLARWQIELGTLDSLEKAEKALERFLEVEPQSTEAWRQLAWVRYRRGNALGEIHAFIERSQLADVTFYDISETASKLNALAKDQSVNFEQGEKRDFASRLLSVMEARIQEANADDLSRMAWLAIHAGQEGKAQNFVETGLSRDPDNYHCQRLSTRLGMST
jgi:hypothetical protein